MQEKYGVLKQGSIATCVAILILALAALACGSSQGGTKVEEKGTSPTATAVTVQTYKIGDVIQVKDHTITLNSVDFSGNVLKANFTVENKGSSDLAVSSAMSFNAKDTEGTKLEQEIFECSPLLDGKVLPGDKSKGNICWKGAVNGPFRIYYEASLFGSGAVVWEVSK